MVTCLVETPPSLGTTVFVLSTTTPANQPSESLQIKVPTGSVTAYKAATNWSAATLVNKISAIE